MDETQQQPLRASFPPAGTAKWLFNASGGSTGGNSFGQDSGYTSYHSTTPNNTFNLSSRHGASATLATIDEANEGDCSMNDSGSSAAGGGVCSNILTPKTAASIDQISNFHLTTPNSAVRPKRPIRRRFDFEGPASEASEASGGSFVAPTTPERLPLSRSVSFDSSDTPLRTGNRSSQQSQLTPHKAKSGHSVKRKLSSLRGKLYSDEGEGETMANPEEDACDENRANDLNDSLDCKRLDISPIPKVKRHKPNEHISNLMRSSTPKTASSQPRFLPGSTENIDSNAVARPGGGQHVAPARKTFRKFQSFSPSKMQANRTKSSLRPRQEDGGWAQGNRLVGRTAGGFGVSRQDPLAELEVTPQKKTNAVGYITPSKEQRVLTEIHQTPTKTLAYQPPMNLAGLINAPILEDPSTAQRDEQLEEAITIVPTFEDFSMTPSKATLIDPELSTGDASALFASDSFVVRRAANFSYGPTLNSIIEEESPIRRRDIGLVAKLMPAARTPPSSSSSSSASSGRKPKRLGTGPRSTSSGSLKASPLAKGVRCVPASPKAAALRRANASLHHLPGMYCGRDQLNVLKRLYERNQDSLHILLDYLTDEDLVQVVQVSKGWKNIIQSLPQQRRRLHQFLKLQRGNKENQQQQRKSSLPVLPPLGKAGELSSAGFEPTDVAAKGVPTAATAERELPPTAAATPADESCVVKRRPFKICNSLDSSSNIGNCSSIANGSAAFLYASFDSECGVAGRLTAAAAATAVPHSSSVSQSKNKFANNQKVVSHLKRSEQLRPCVRCGESSRVVLSRSSKNGQNKARSGAVAARLEKSYTLPEWDTGNDLNGTIHKPISAEFQRGFPDGSNSDAGRNNNDYSATCSSSSNSLNSSPNRVRKNLFNSGSASSNRSVSSAAVLPLKSSTDGRRNSEPHLPDMVRTGDRRRLRSGAKSVDYLAYPDVAGTSADALDVRDSKCDYAVCSSCKYQFCIKCLCKYHPDTACPDLAPNSPSKEEDRGQPNVACSRQSLRSLQRLCRKL